MPRATRYRLPAPIDLTRRGLAQDHLFVVLITLAATVILVSLLLLAWTYQPPTPDQPRTFNGTTEVTP